MKYLIATIFFVTTQLLAADIGDMLTKLGSDNYDTQNEARDELLIAFADASAPHSESDGLGVMLKSVYPLLNGEMPAVSRSYLIRLIELFGEPESASVLYPLLGDPNPVIRDSARRALAALSDQEANVLLMQGLLRAPAEQRPSFMQALAYSGYTPAAMEIVQFLDSADSKTQGTAAWALGELGQKDTRSALFAARNSVLPENRLLVDAALLEIGLNAEVAEILVDTGSHSGIRFGAFEQLIELDPSRAEQLLKAAISDSDFPARVDIFSATMQSSSDTLRAILVGSMESLPIADQILIVAAISDSRDAKYEPLVIELLSTEDDALRKSAVEALGWIGGDRSFPAMYALALNNGGGGIMDALARLNAPAADEKLLAAVQEPSDNASAVAALKMVALRNSPGGTELVNSIVRESENKELAEASFLAIEKIGNLESAKALIDVIFREDALKRPAQKSLKRFSMNFGIPEFQWEAIYEPALENASSSQKESIIQVLDAVACQDSLDYLEASLADPQLRASVIRSLQRWTDYDVALVWVNLASEDGVTEKEKSTAIKGLKRTFESDSMEGSFSDKAKAAAAAIELASDPQFKIAILEPFQGNIPSKKMKDFKKAFQPLADDADVGETISAIIQ